MSKAVKVPDPLYKKLKSLAETKDISLGEALYQLQGIIYNQGKRDAGEKILKELKDIKERLKRLEEVVIASSVKNLFPK